MNHLKLTQSFTPRSQLCHVIRTVSYTENNLCQNIFFAFLSSYNITTGLTGLSVAITGPTGDTIGRKTRGVRTHSREEGDCLASQDALK